MTAQQAVATEEATSAQSQAPGPAKAESRRVRMTQAELGLYVREGRPTGLLLKSMATLKGMSADSIARASGIPAALVTSIFDDKGVGALKPGAIKKVAAVVGIDLSCMRLSAGQVHIFHMSNLPSGPGAGEGFQMMRGIGLLARCAKVAELRIGSGLTAMRWSGRMHVAQFEQTSMLFVGSRSKRFCIDTIPSGAWACGKREQTIVPVENQELTKHLLSFDLTEGEFQELFLGRKALTWDDVRVASRVNGVSKSELMAFIISRSAEIEKSEDDAGRRAAADARPSLRLVDVGTAEKIAA